MTSTEKVRVRFAPSPTGYLHVGGARTALFNWLFARHNGGALILRIEDTDQARSSEEHVRAILDGLAWLGLDCDEGPFFQSQSVARHRDDALRLLEEGKAYVCFCPPQELEAKRQKAQAEKIPYKYDRTCLKLAPSERSRRVAAGEPHCVRFRIPEGETAFDDAVHREVTVNNAQIEDFVLLRSDRTPTYMLSVVSDDVAMRVTHIIRGDDHISNTPKQVLLYRALGQEPPRFAHLPLLLGEDKKKLSKRHGAVAVGDYRERGILPQAMVNFLALLGWSPDDGQEILSREELIRRFSLEGVGNRGAVFDHQKLEWMNGQYLSRMSSDALWPDVERELRRHGLWREEFAGARREWLRRWIDLMKTRARVVGDLAEDGRPYLTDEVDYAQALASKHLRDPEAAGRLEGLASVLERIEPFAEAGIEPALRGEAERLGVPAAKLIHPARLAVTGKEVGPGLFELLAFLGRDVCVRRLRALAALLRERPAAAAR
jgi:glutamyl-tRNA synthetase